MYILRIGNNLFVKKVAEDIILTKDYTQAIQYKKIGDAMRTASELNTLINNSIVKIIKYD